MMLLSIRKTLGLSNWGVQAAQPILVWNRITIGAAIGDIVMDRFRDVAQQLPRSRARLLHSEREATCFRRPRAGFSSLLEASAHIYLMAVGVSRLSRPDPAEAPVGTKGRFAHMKGLPEALWSLHNSNGYMMRPSYIFYLDCQYENSENRNYLRMAPYTRGKP